VTISRIHHTAVAVKDMNVSIARYRELFSTEVSDRTVVPDQGVEVAFLAIGDTRLELVQPLDDTSGVARFLQTRGEGLHHIGVAVTDITSELDRLRQEGYVLLDEKPRQGAHGLIAFVNPRSTGGVLLELVQE
jgi:methylmalonyl-CoA epimerase